jgi:hypothetical protein
MNLMSVTFSGLVSPNVRERVLTVERMLQKAPQVECPVRHYFIPGMYAREITIPAKTIITGAVHKQESIVVLSAGRMRLATEDGELEIRAPFTMTVMPGAKNLAVALEDCVWTNFFATDETDLDKLAELLTESKASELLGGRDNVQLLNNMRDQLWHSESQLALG